MQVYFKGDLELGANAIHARNQHRVAILLSIHGKEPAEAANFTEHAFGKGLVRQILDALLGTVGLGDIHAGIGVGDGGRTLR